MSGAPQLLWFDGPTDTALVLAASALLHVAVFPDARLVFRCGDATALLSRATRGWQVRRLAGRLAVDTVLLLPGVAAALLALRGGEVA